MYQNNYQLVNFLINSGVIHPYICCLLFNYLVGFLADKIGFSDFYFDFDNLSSLVSWTCKRIVYCSHIFEFYAGSNEIYRTTCCYQFENNCPDLKTKDRCCYTF